MVNDKQLLADARWARRVAAFSQFHEVRVIQTDDGGYPCSITVVDELGLRVHVPADVVDEIGTCAMQPEDELIDFLESGVIAARQHPHLYRKGLTWPTST